MFPFNPIALAAQQVENGSALTNSTTATSIIPQTGVAQIPASAVQIGSTIYMNVRGKISTVVTTPGTLTFTLVIGGATVSTFGAIALNTVAQTNATFELDIVAQVRAIGPAANTCIVTPSARFTSRAILGSPAVGTGGAGVMMLPDTGLAQTGTGFNNNALASVDVFAQWSVASASNSILVSSSWTELKV